MRDKKAYPKRKVKTDIVYRIDMGTDPVKEVRPHFSPVKIGFIIGVIQDSCETGVNSSTDVLYTAIADFRDRRINPEHYANKPFDPEIKIL